MTNHAADILDAMGRPADAATLRWREEPREDIARERNAVAGELTHATDMLQDLESLLCKLCARRWKEAQP